MKNVLKFVLLWSSIWNAAENVKFILKWNEKKKEKILLININY